MSSSSSMEYSFPSWILCRHSLINNETAIEDATSPASWPPIPSATIYKPIRSVSWYQPQLSSLRTRTNPTSLIPATLESTASLSNVFSSASSARPISTVFWNCCSRAFCKKWWISVCSTPTNFRKVSPRQAKSNDRWLSGTGPLYISRITGSKKYTESSSESNKKLCNPISSKTMPFSCKNAKTPKAFCATFRTIFGVRSTKTSNGWSIPGCSSSNSKKSMNLLVCVGCQRAATRNLCSRSSSLQFAHDVSYVEDSSVPQDQQYFWGRSGRESFTM